MLPPSALNLHSLPNSAPVARSFRFPADCTGPAHVASQHQQRCLDFILSPTQAGARTPSQRSALNTPFSRTTAARAQERAVQDRSQASRSAAATVLLLLARLLLFLCSISTHNEQRTRPDQVPHLSSTNALTVHECQ